MPSFQEIPELLKELETISPSPQIIDTLWSLELGPQNLDKYRLTIPKESPTLYEISL